MTHDEKLHALNVRILKAMNARMDIMEDKINILISVINDLLSEEEKGKLKWQEQER